MKNYSIKAFGSIIFAVGLVVAGVAAPANAAALGSPSITSTGAVTTGAVTVPLTITATTVSSGADRFRITLPTGWTTSIVGSPNCSGVTATGIDITGSGCSSSGSVITLWQNSGTLSAGTTITATIQANKLTAAAARDFTLTTADGTGNLDSSVVTLAGAPSSYTVTFDANGGTGTTAAQTASTTTALTANGFSRSGYNFAGWNTAANGSGTAYANGASYAFASSTTLYAQWTATLANTGINTPTGISLLAGGLSLALVGAEMFMIARRKRSN